MTQAIPEALKRVAVRDRRAGTMFYLICTAVLIYIFGYEFYCLPSMSLDPGACVSVPQPWIGPALLPLDERLAIRHS